MQACGRGGGGGRGVGGGTLMTEEKRSQNFNQREKTRIYFPTKDLVLFFFFSYYHSIIRDLKVVQRDRGRCT